MARQSVSSVDAHALRADQAHHLLDLERHRLAGTGGASDQAVTIGQGRQPVAWRLKPQARSAKPACAGSGSPRRGLRSAPAARFSATACEWKPAPRNNTSHPCQRPGAPGDREPFRLPRPPGQARAAPLCYWPRPRGQPGEHGGCALPAHAPGGRQHGEQPERRAAARRAGHGARPRPRRPDAGRRVLLGVPVSP